MPPWLVKTIATTLIGLSLAGAVGWGKGLSDSTLDHAERIAVVEDHQKGIDKSLDEIKSMQKQQAQDTKEILLLLGGKK